MQAAVGALLRSGSHPLGVVDAAQASCSGRQVRTRRRRSPVGDSAAVDAAGRRPHCTVAADTDRVISARRAPAALGRIVARREPELAAARRADLQADSERGTWCGLTRRATVVIRG
jgi:hypothetical protein